MEKAILKAIEGGWKYKGDEYFERRSLLKSINTYCLYSFHDDPEFWKCLGVACDWDKNIYEDIPCELCSKLLCPHKIVKGELITAAVGAKGYVYHWHSFIDHLAEGGSVDDFFKKLIN